MNFQEKLVKLRRAAALSQEELADRLGVSRQAVSKWEAGYATPDVDKIVMLSELFGVSTDYLLKGSEEGAPREQDVSAQKSNAGDTNELAEERDAPIVGCDEVRDFLNAKRKAALLIGIAVLLFILSPVLLIIAGGLSENGSVPEYSALIIGLAWLFSAIASGVALCIAAGYATKDSPLGDGKVTLDTEAAALVKAERESSSPLFTLFYIIGTALCIISPLPLIVTAIWTEQHFDGAEGRAQELLLVLMTALLLALVAVGVFFLTYAAIRDEAQKKLLAPERETRRSRILSTLTSVYWYLVSAAYLLISFLTNRWDISWIIWPLAPIVPSIVSAIFKRD